MVDMVLTTQILCYINNFSNKEKIMLNNKIKRKLRRMIKNVGSDAMLSLLPYSEREKECQANLFKKNYSEENNTQYLLSAAGWPLVYLLSIGLSTLILSVGVVPFAIIASVITLTLAGLEVSSVFKLQEIRSCNLAYFLTIVNSFGEKEVEKFILEETAKLNEKFKKKANLESLSEFTDKNKNTLEKITSNKKVSYTKLTQPERKIEKQEIKNIDTKTKENDKEKTL